MKTMFVWNFNLAVHAPPTSCSCCPEHSAVVIASSLEEAIALLAASQREIGNELRGECRADDHSRRAPNGPCWCEMTDLMERDLALGLALSPPSDVLHIIDSDCPSQIILEDFRTEAP